MWNAENFPAYRRSRPRFVAEFGWQAPPAWRTLRDAVSGTLAPDAPGVVHHQKAVNGQAKLAAGIRASFGELGALDLDTWHYLAQLVQARAIRAGIEHWRAGWPHTAGVILWQLNDLWPANSWSAVDSAGRRKPLFHELRRLFDDRLVSIEPQESVPVAALHNLGGTSWEVRAVLERRHSDGTVAESYVVDRTVAPGTVATITMPDRLVAGLATSGDFLVADPGSGRRAFWFGDSDAGVQLDAPRYDVEVRSDAGDSIVTVTARTLVRDLFAQADRLSDGGVADRGFVTLLPGERVDIRISGTVVRPDDLAAPFVLTSLGEVLAAARHPDVTGMNEPWNGSPSTVPATFTSPCVPKNSAELGQTT